MHYHVTGKSVILKAELDRKKTILTGALSCSTEKLHTIHVSGSFSLNAGIFLMADKYSTSL